MENQDKYKTLVDNTFFDERRDFGIKGPEFSHGQILYGSAVSVGLRYRGSDSADSKSAYSCGFHGDRRQCVQIYRREKKWEEQRFFHRIFVVTAGSAVFVPHIPGTCKCTVRQRIYSGHGSVRHSVMLPFSMCAVCKGKGQDGSFCRTELF